MFEWTEITAEELETVRLEMWIIELIWEYQRQMKDLVLRFIGRNVILEEIDITRGSRTIPFAGYINIIERNLKNLVGTDAPEDMIKTVEWHGMLKDDRRLDYTDVNRWFETIRVLYKFILTLQQRYLTTGTFHSGHSPDLQLLGVV